MKFIALYYLTMHVISLNGREASAAPYGKHGF